MRHSVSSIVYTAESQRQQQDEDGPLRGQDAVAPSKAENVHLNDRSTARRQRHAATTFRNRQEVISVSERDCCSTGDRRPTEVDVGTDELTSCCCESGRSCETKWRRVAEILDRFFFLLFLLLLVVPTATILGITRFFKPEL